MNKAVWILLLTYISHVCACRYREEQQHQRRKWRRNSSKAAEENTPDMDNLLLMKENCVLCMVGLWLIRAPELKRKVSLLILLPWVCWWLLLFPNIRKTAVPYSERGSFFWASHAAEKKIHSWIRSTARTKLQLLAVLQEMVPKCNSPEWLD